MQREALLDQFLDRFAELRQVLDMDLDGLQDEEGMVRIPIHLWDGLVDLFDELEEGVCS